MTTSGWGDLATEGLPRWMTRYHAGKGPPPHGGGGQDPPHGPSPPQAWGPHGTAKTAGGHGAGWRSPREPIRRRKTVVTTGREAAAQKGFESEWESATTSAPPALVRWQERFGGGDEETAVGLSLAEPNGTSAAPVEDRREVLAKVHEAEAEVDGLRRQIELLEQENLALKGLSSLRHRTYEAQGRVPLQTRIASDRLDWLKAEHEALAQQLHDAEVGPVAVPEAAVTAIEELMKAAGMIPIRA